MSGLKVVALISGGKDSFFSILHCLANGHEVVALANLYPPLENGEQSEDIDSFMYQTVGHSVIPLYEEALGLPLYRQEILGSAVDSNKSYATPLQTGQEAAISSDETESLVPLLHKVVSAHPEVNAVSTGAILSDYQRTRVESVAIRLGLTPLSYLWQYPFLPPYSETSLLDDMSTVGQDARIIKVASGGLDDSFLWDNVASMRTKGRLVKAMQRFGTLGDGAAVGEGGEFETLAIDGPWPLWKSSIQVEPDERLVVAGDAGVASLKIRNACLVAKDATESSTTMSDVLEDLRRPPMLDDKFADLQSRLESFSITNDDRDECEKSKAPREFEDFRGFWSIKQNDNGLVLLSNCSGNGKGSSAGEQMRIIMDEMANSYKIEPSSIVFTTILLRDMSDFGAVNAAYGACFTTPNPPARVTIACGDTLPADTDVLLSVIALSHRGQETKRGLHVQSRSYWAPANIGPYSQAVSLPVRIANGRSKASMVYVAGQIPLVPTVMDFPQRGPSSPVEHFRTQAVLALQHLWRIGQIMDVKLWLGAVAFVSKSSDVSARARVDTVLQAWKFAHASSDNATSDDDNDEDEDVDLWDRTHGSHQTLGQAVGTHTKRPEIQNTAVPPCFVVEVEELPRNAPIEWASIGAAFSSKRFNITGE